MSSNDLDASSPQQSATRSDPNSSLLSADNPLWAPAPIQRSEAPQPVPSTILSAVDAEYARLETEQRAIDLEQSQEDHAIAMQRIAADLNSHSSLPEPARSLRYDQALGTIHYSVLTMP